MSSFEGAWARFGGLCPPWPQRRTTTDVIRFCRFSAHFYVLIFSLLDIVCLNSSTDIEWLGSSVVRSPTSDSEAAGSSPTAGLLSSNNLEQVVYTRGAQAI